MSIGTRTVTHNLADSKGKFIRLWTNLTEPSKSLKQPEQRSQARLLAAVSLLLALVVAGALLLFRLLGADFLFALSTALFLGLAAAYALSRSAYANIGAILILLVSILVPIVGFLANPTQDYVLAILVNAIAFSSVYFSGRVTRAIVAAELIMLVALALIRPEFTPLHLILLVFFLLTESLLIVFIAHFRQQNGAQQEAQARAVAESELRYRLLAENVTDFICRHKLDGSFLFASPASHPLLGYEPEELLGKSPYDFIHPDDTAIVRASHENVLTTTQSDLVVYRFRRKDGSYIWFESTSKVIRDPQTGTPWEIVTVSRDISRRKQVEENLRQTNLRLEASRDTLQRLIQQMPMGVQVFDTSGLCTDINQAYMEIFGVHSRDQVIGKFNILEHLANNQIGKDIRTAFRQAAAGNVVHMGEFEMNFSLANPRFTSRTGLLTLSVDFCPIYDENHTIVNVVALNQDITERKWIEANLRQTNLRLEASRATLQRLIQQMPIGIQMFDTNGLCTDVNETHVAIFGLSSRAQVVGKFNILSDRLAEKVGTQDGYKRALAGEVAYVGEVEFDFEQADPRFTAVTGEHFLSVSFFPIYDENRTIVGVVALNQDITERKLAERALKQLADELLQQTNTLNAILSATPDQLAIFDREGRYLYVNPPGLAVLGADMPAAQNKTWRDMNVLQEIGEHFEQIRAQVFATGQPASGVSLYPLSSGMREFEYTLSPIFDAEGRVVLMVSTTRDVTEQRQAEQERFALALERERVKMLQHLISDTSHDLKTPLATLNTSLYLLKKTISDPERREHYTEVLQAQVVNLTKILEDMDSMARLDGASDKFEFKPVDLNELLRQIVIEHETLASKKNQRLAFSAGDAIPPLHVDETKLRRAITNLVTNALNYTPEGGEITTNIYRQEGNAVIEIRDNGMGIAPNELALIFDRFYRSEESRKNYSNGSGLGLAITKKIVEGHGGTIQVESEIGKGSIFRIVLPVKFA